MFPYTFGNTEIEKYETYVSSQRLLFILSSNSLKNPLEPLAPIEAKFLMEPIWEWAQEWGT